MRAKLINELDIIEKIKQFLIEDSDHENWKDFVDNQSIGDCQSIVKTIIDKFPEAKKIFGEIEVDEPYIDEDGDEQIQMTHHWIIINGVQYDFSKGTLINYIDFDEYDLYDPEIIDEWRYNKIY